MNRIFKTAALVFCLLGNAAAGHSQQPKVSVEMDSTYVTFGCPMTFHLQAIVPEGQQIIFPQDVLSRGGIVAYDDSAQYLLELDTFKPISIDTLQHESGYVTLREDLTVFVFDSATFYIPPFEFVAQSGDTLRTNVLALKVFVPFESVEVDPQKFVGIKDVEAPEFVFMDYIWYFLIPHIVLALLVAAWFGWQYYKRHKKNAPVVVPKVKPRPPHVIAMEALDNLAGKKLWQNGRDKEFHTELTEILRQYIEARFGVPAMEKTSDEILDELYELAESQKASLANLKQILSIADLVKFAKYHPFADENQLSFVNSRMFVEQTKKEEIESPEKEAAEGSEAEAGTVYKEQ
ncbi:MAG: hypothetical protein IKX59_11600 [Bacteroidales bacterium]|nr:hypothetical protein [Bacteroidales bacterium]